MWYDTQYSIGNVNVHVTEEAVLYIISESHNNYYIYYTTKYRIAENIGENKIWRFAS